ncbi:MAG: hypothetical protein NVS1B11_00160 [Terriglobales bacterium]
MDNNSNSEKGFEFSVRLWGMDSDNRPFFQNATASDVKGETAKLSGLTHTLHPGDVIGVQSGERKARCRIVWIVDAGLALKTEAGVELLPGQQIPWPEPPIVKEVAESGKDWRTKDHRKFARYKIFFPVEISFEDQQRGRMQTNATDISGRGFYVETMMPLAIDTVVKLMFWMNEEKLRADGVVRTCDPCMGMGIEFTSLDDNVQQRLQKFIEKMQAEAARSNPTSAESAEAASAQSAGEANDTAKAAAATTGMPDTQNSAAGHSQTVAGDNS